MTSEENIMITIPFFELEFNKKADQVNQAEWQLIKQALKHQAYTDVIVLSHGWNNDMDDARRLYNALLKLIQAELDKKQLSNRKFMAMGVLWPSKKFADKELIPGGAASTDTNPAKSEVIDDCRKLEEFMDLKSRVILEDIRKSLESNAEADEVSMKFKNLFESMGRDESKNEDTLPIVNLDRINMMFIDEGFWMDNDEGIGGDGVQNVDSESGNGEGVIPLSLWTGILGGVQNILNVTTYYLMKDRSGLIGRSGLNPVLRKIKQVAPGIRIHLVGHSFGARLVSSAIMGEKIEDEIAVDSLSLLQAAFSHYAFAGKYDGSKDGLFRSVVTKKLVQGPFFITHTRFDKAVGIAYAVASRVAGQAGQGLGGKNDLYGGLGGNGAQKTDEAVSATLLATGGVYDFKPEKVFNLKSDEYISGHSDIIKPQVAGALVSAFLT
ncbi:MAG: hypothetical protein P0Y49_11005 [Candidatus Pedobacter colombiensis]|uniref:Alpha/beta hydrolase n=1 Tax=Candidatus Pedobacter colombiensis TaxID=3121371 RepID=A0AAJ6BAV5_9SPHI|nr:hypothetical protein [Pedobacter sp.]WEK21663.1 MAG: hypothetical protein P0Y49_11005 [Pedobacter sp.]